VTVKVGGAELSIPHDPPSTHSHVISHLLGDCGCLYLDIDSERHDEYSDHDVGDCQRHDEVVGYSVKCSLNVDTETDQHVTEQRQ